jgi:hypothetical protein
MQTNGKSYKYVRVKADGVAIAKKDPQEFVGVLGKSLSISVKGLD